MSQVSRGLSVPSHSSERKSVLVLQGIRGDAFAQARATGLMRGLAEFGEVILVDLDADDGIPANQRITDAMTASGASVVVICWAGPADRIEWAGIYAQTVIAAPARVGPGGILGLSRATVVLNQVWARSDAEAATLRRQIPGVAVTVIPDQFDIFAPEPEPKRSGAVAMLASVDAPGATLASLHAELFSGDDGPAPVEVLAPPLVHDRLAARGLVGRTIRVGSVAEAIAQAPRAIIHADDPEARYLVALATASECETKIVGQKDAPPRWRLHGAATSHQAVVRAIGDALGAERVETDDAETGARLARAAALQLEADFIYYIPSMQLVHAELLVRANAPQEAIGGYLETSGTERDRLVNAWVQVLPTNQPNTFRLRATTAMPPEGRPDGIELVVELWGLTASRIPLGQKAAEVGAGLISMTQTAADRVSVEYWAPPSGANIQFGTKLASPEPRSVGSNGLATYTVEAPFPFNRDTLTVLTGGTVGRIQKFTALKTYTKDYRTSSLRLAALKDRHEGQVGWLVGNGPSVRPEDLDRLAETGAVKFCFNRFYLAHERTRLVADYTVTADQQMIRDFGDEILERSGGTVFMADFTAPELTGDYCWVRQVNVFPSLFSRDPTRFVTPGGSSLYVAMQIGHYMGIRKWYVYGADFEFNLKRDKSSADVWRAATGDNNHFIPGYRSGKAWCPPSIENILPSFLAARQLIELDGGFIRNATRGGRLDVFERTTFEDAIAAS